MAADVETVKYHAYETGKLPIPVIIKRRSYWAKKDLDTLFENLSNRPRVDNANARKYREAQARQRQAQAKRQRAAQRFEAAEQELREIESASWCVQKAGSG